MILNISKAKTESLLLFCKDLILSYKDITDTNDYGIDKDIIENFNNIGNEMLKQILNVTLPTNYYLQNIKNDSIVLPTVRSEDNHVWHQFVARTNKRDELQKYLLDNGVQTLIHYPMPPHKQNAYNEWNNRTYPISEQIHEKVLSLPISGVQSLEDTIKIVQIINNFN